MSCAMEGPWPSRAAVNSTQSLDANPQMRRTVTTLNPASKTKPTPPYGERGGRHRRTRSKLRRTGEQARCDRGSKNAQPEQSEAGKHQRHGLRDVGLLALQRGGELGEEVGAYADDDGEHHHLDARGDDRSQHAFGEEAGSAPQRERHEDEAGERGQLELDDRHEQDRKSTRLNSSH